LLLRQRRLPLILLFVIFILTKQVVLILIILISVLCRISRDSSLLLLCVLRRTSFRFQQLGRFPRLDLGIDSRLILIPSLGLGSEFLHRSSEAVLRSDLVRTASVTSLDFNGIIAHLQDHTADTLNLGLLPIDNLLQVANFLIKQFLLLSQLGHLLVLVFFLVFSVLEKLGRSATTCSDGVF
jgi:hypothetical protein